MFMQLMISNGDSDVEDDEDNGDNAIDDNNTLGALRCGEHQPEQKARLVPRKHLGHRVCC